MPDFDPPELGGEDFTFLSLLDRAADGTRAFEQEPADKEGPVKNTPMRRTGKKPRNTGPSKATRLLVLERDKYTCVSCGTLLLGQFYSLQHRQARGMGGTSDPQANSPVNLVTLCGSATTPGSCHLACEQRDETMHARGYWLRHGEDPAIVPVMVSGLGVRWLTPDGSYSDDPPGEAAA